jgi:hypothetical protein
MRGLLETITYARPIHVIRQCAAFHLRRNAVQLLLDDMFQPFRNPLIGIALGSAAFLAVALLDGAFTNFMPSVSSLPVAQTNLATCLSFAVLVVAFLLAGYWGRRWRTGLVWLLVPLVALYVRAVATAPYVYACHPARLWWCAFVHAPFVIGIVACCIGYSVRRSTVGAQHVG